MKRRALLSLGVSTAILASCGGGGSRPSQPNVDLVLVEKSKRKMSLMRNGKALKVFHIDLGFNPVGHKQFEGDGKTPEGDYFIWTKNPRSAFYLSLGISYPNQQDVDFARRYGRSPGGDIFIHGEATDPRQRGKTDWTAGCISVSNTEMLEIYRMVGVGTKVRIVA